MKKKKIGILTFQRTVNYGAQFQNFALQEYLNSYKDLDVEVINYENDQVNKIEKRATFFEQKNIKDIIKYLKNGHSKNKRWDRFEEFRNEYINLSKYYDKHNINEVNRIYDYFVVGSDQVWNTIITDNDTNYYLDFVVDDSKKFSYAASIGNNDIFLKDNSEFINLLKKFQKINVREESAKKILEKNKLNNIDVVVDPTFLMTKDEWINKLDLKKEKDKYILVYMIDNARTNMKKIRELAKREKLEIIYINNNFFNELGINNNRTASPVQFLNYLYNSKYVVTGSFHAICLSIIFNKNFYYILNKKIDRNSRITDLIQKLNIKDNDITDSVHINLCNIDYNIVNELIKKEIEKSKKIIENMIKNWE